ncbi:MAG: hypothetical protein AB7F23_01435 [Phycisphaerae bacterium]
MTIKKLLMLLLMAVAFRADVLFRVGIGNTRYEAFAAGNVNGCDVPPH